MLRFDLAQFFLGAQIDGAEPFALAAQTIDGRFDLAGLGEFSFRLQLGKLGQRVRFDITYTTQVAPTGEPGED